MDLPATTRHYPAQEAPGRVGIRSVSAPTPDPDNTLKPDREHKPDRNSKTDRKSRPTSSGSTDTQSTRVSSGGIHTGLGTRMPWMDVHARRVPEKPSSPAKLMPDRYSLIAKRMPEKTNGTTLPAVKEERVEREEEGSSPGKEARGDRGGVGRILLVTCCLIIIVLILIGTVVAVLYIHNDDDDNSDESNGDSNENTITKSEYFLANYEASMSIREGNLTEDLRNLDSALYFSTTQLNCEKVNFMYSADTYRDIYGGCEGRGFREEGGSVYMDLYIKILYTVEVSIPERDVGTGEDSRLLAERLDDVRRGMTAQLRASFSLGVFEQPQLSRPEFNDEPTIIVVSSSTDYCLPHQCNGGECIKWVVNGINTSYNCVCADNRTGRNCQVVTN